MLRIMGAHLSPRNLDNLALLEALRQALTFDFSSLGAFELFGIGRFLRLQTEKLAVGSVLQHQGVVSPGFHDPAVIEHQDHVGIPDGRQAVGDHKRRPVPDQICQGLLHKLFRFGIQGGSRLIENQDRGIFQQRPGDRYPLAFAAGKPLASFADHRVVLHRELCR